MMSFNESMEYMLVKAKLADLYRDQALRYELEALGRERGQNCKFQEKKGLGSLLKLLKALVFKAV